MANDLNKMDSVACVVTSGGVCAGTSGSGSVVVSTTTNVGVKQVTSGNMDVTLQPNPNKGIFTVKGTLGTTADEEVTLEMTDLVGQVIYTSKVVAHGGNINEKVQVGGNIANRYVYTERAH